MCKQQNLVYEIIRSLEHDIALCKRLPRNKRIRLPNKTKADCFILGVESAVIHIKKEVIKNV